MMDIAYNLAGGMTMEHILQNTPYIALKHVLKDEYLSYILQIILLTTTPGVAVTHLLPEFHSLLVCFYPK